MIGGQNDLLEFSVSSLVFVLTEAVTGATTRQRVRRFVNIDGHASVVRQRSVKSDGSMGLMDIGASSLWLSRPIGAARVRVRFVEKVFRRAKAGAFPGFK